MFKPDDNQFEQSHFNSILTLSKENLEKYEAEEKALSDELYTLLETYGAKDVEALSMIDNIQVLYERAQHEAVKARKARNKPFFGRIDFIDLKSNSEDTLYIGKTGIARDITHLEVIDWRAPVANAYYESHLGELTYTVANEGSFDIDLKKKRTYEIKDDELTAYFDAEVVANDELLNKYLSQNKKAVLGEIIATIQKEQNDIIRQSPYKSMIVQGAAGSGKTTVAMHRISYILYNYEKDFKPADFYIIGSNRILLNYITSVLPDLDVNGVRQMTMEELFVRLLYEDWDCDRQHIAPLTLPSATFPDSLKRGTLKWFQELEIFCISLERSMINTRDVILKSNENVLLEHDVCVTLLTSESTLAFLDENPGLSIQSKINLLNKRVLARLENEITGKGIQYSPEEKKALIRFYRQYFGPKKWKLSIYDIYSDFLKNQGKRYNTVFPFDPQNPDLYDLAALAYIYKRTKEDDPIVEAHHVVIDEAQDFGMMAYMALHYCMRGCTYTIMGDVAQNIHYEHGLNDWNELTENFLTGEFDTFNLLRKSYRNTVEISHFATDILRHGSFSVYPVEPVIRHGNEVSISKCADSDELLQSIAGKIEEWKKSGFETIAVICPDAASSKSTAMKLSEYTQVNDFDAMEFDTGTMVLPITYTKGLEFDCCILMNPDDKAYPPCDANVKLLYVAATRALHELALYHTGTLTPIISGPVPDDVKNIVLEAANIRTGRRCRPAPVVSADSVATTTSVTSAASVTAPVPAHPTVPETSTDAGNSTTFAAPGNTVASAVSGTPPASTVPGTPPASAVPGNTVASAVYGTPPASAAPANVTATQNRSRTDNYSAARSSAPAVRQCAPAARPAIVDSSNRIMCQSEFSFGSMPKTDALRQNPKPMSTYTFRNVRRTGNSLILDSINAVIELTPYAATMIRVSYHKAGETIPPAQCIAARDTYDKWNYKDTPDTALLATSALYLHIDKKTGLMTFCDKEKNIILKEAQPGRVLEPAAGRSLCFFDFDLSHKLYAYGESNRAHLPLNRVARYISFGNSRLKAPCVISEKGYGIVIAHDSTVLFNSIPTYGSFISLTDAQYFDYFFFTGTSEEDFIKKYNWIRSKNIE